MELHRRRKFVYALLAGAWLLVVLWQVAEHRRVVEAAKSDLRNRSHEIAGTLGAVTRALRFRGAIFQERLEPVLNELVTRRTNAFANPTGLAAIALLNNGGDPVLSAGQTNLFSREILAEPEHWSEQFVTFVLPVEGASVNPEGATNSTVVLPPRPRDFTNGPPRGDFSRRDPRAAENNSPANEFPTNPPVVTNIAGEMEPPPPPPENRDRRDGGHRPPWMRGMSDADFKAFAARRELHGLALAMSTENYRAVCVDDLWLRFVIGFFAGISAVGAGLAWRNTGRNADLQIRLVRASELNSHLKEMNLAAAGLAHETRNPLNIIRGHAQMISRASAAPDEVRAQSKTIVDETDKVTAQLTEFINYSRPREVRRTKINLPAAAAEIVRTLNFDIAEKNLHIEISGEPLSIEADDHLLRQILFNLILNAIQVLGENGKIQVNIQRVNPAEAALEIRDDGPGVPRENRSEIFKPYFTTHQKGTGLGLAVVQQNVHAHGWEITCLPNEPRGATFRITHLKIAS